VEAKSTSADPDLASGEPALKSPRDQSGPGLPPRSAQKDTMGRARIDDEHFAADPSDFGMGSRHLPGTIFELD
jgi:hypothetical protein